jgi:signal transduction histidine kinase
MAKSRFFATMSHEIRTPIHTISLTSELLQTCQMEVDAVTHVEIITESVSHLKKLVDDILSLAKLEDHGQLQLESLPINFQRLMREVLSLTCPTSKVAMRLDWKPSALEALKSAARNNSDVVGDVVRVKQVPN